MIDKRTIAEPTTHYGAPRGATRLFGLQRLTGALNVMFLGFFVWFVVGLAGAGREQMVETVRNPFVAIVLALLVVNVAVHMRIGMREVIEDYIDEGRNNRLALAANDGFAALIAGAGLIAIVKIVFWG